MQRRGKQIESRYKDLVLLALIDRKKNRIPITGDWITMKGIKQNMNDKIPMESLRGWMLGFIKSGVIEREEIEGSNVKYMYRLKTDNIQEIDILENMCRAKFTH